MAGVSTKEIKNRIRSMESTKQITKAMEMVAASKLRRAQAQIANSRPYFQILRETIDGIVENNRDFSSPYLTARPVKKVAGSLKLLYSQYRELQSFAQFGSDLDADTKARLALGERIVAVLKQKNNAPKEVAQQVCIIYAVIHGYLNTIDVDKIPEFEKQLEEHMDNRYPQVLEAIRTSGKLESDTEAGLKTALDELLTQFA